MDVLKKLSKMKNKLYLLILTAPVLLISCEGSRTRRMIDTGKGIYDEYEETGDPTGLILFIVALLAIGALWLWNKSKDK